MPRKVTTCAEGCTSKAWPSPTVAVSDDVATAGTEPVTRRRPAPTSRGDRLATVFAGKRYAVLGLARSGLATVEALVARGHRVVEMELTSGLQAIQRTSTGWFGGADPRREGVVRGD